MTSYILTNTPHSPKAHTMFLVESKEHACGFSHYATISDARIWFLLMTLMQHDKRKHATWTEKGSTMSLFITFSVKLLVFLRGGKRLHVSQTGKNIKYLASIINVERILNFLQIRAHNSLYSVRGLKHKYSNLQSPFLSSLLEFLFRKVCFALSSKIKWK